MSIQPDLFGEFDQREQAFNNRQATLAAWREMLHADPAPLPYDCMMGAAGEVVDQWWRCPGCSRVELSSYALWINHGFHPDWPDQTPWAWATGGCSRQGRAS